ncbi:hypothetical protein KFZ73_05295, partial [Tsukamurella paurometabola]
VLVHTGGGVEAGAGGRVADLLGDDAGLEAGVDGDLLDRGVERDLDDVRAGGLGVADGVLDAVLALLELDLGRGTGLTGPSLPLALSPAPSAARSSTRR